METPLLQTKLYISPPRPDLVPRPRLIERLNQGLHRTPGLTLVSAPAGFGKTTLVSSWLQHNERPAAWLSLDEGDNQVTRFLTYLIAALQQIDPAVHTPRIADDQLCAIAFTSGSTGESKPNRKTWKTLHESMASTARLLLDIPDATLEIVATVPPSTCGASK